MRCLGPRCTSLLLAACLFQPFAGAQQPAAEPAPPLFADIASALPEVRGVTIAKPTQRRLPAPVGPESYGFHEHLPGHQLLLTVNLGVITDSSSVIRTLEAVHAASRVQCAGKELKLTEPSPRVEKVVFGQPGDALMTATLPKLHDGGLLGKFDCIDADGRIQSSVRVEWDRGERNPSEVIPADQWRFRIESISADRLNRQSTRFKEFKRQTDALREKPTPGTQVQLSPDDVPASLAARLPRPFNPSRLPYFVCALVTDAKGTLAEVQIDQVRWMVPATKLLPGGTPATSAEIGVQLELKNPAYRTCMRP